MAVEPIYRPQVGAGGTAGLPQASAEAFGAGIGQGMAQLGGAMHEADVRAYRIERQQRADTEASDFAARFATLRAEADKASIDARNAAAPGGAGHAEAMAKWWQDRSAQLTDGITEDRVRRAAAEQISEFGARFDAAEYQWQEGARVGKVVTDRQRASDAGANRARQMHDPKAYAEELSLGRQSIDMLEGVPADVKDKLRRYHDETVTVGFLNGLTDTNPALAKAQIDAGIFNDILTPQQIDQARGGAEVEIRRRDGIVAAQQAAVKAETREQLATLNARIEAGEDVPDGEIAGGAQAATAIGDDSGAFKLEVARQKAWLNRETQAWRPQDYETNINALRAMGERRTPAQDITLKHLETIAPGRIAEYTNNPGGYMAAIGKAAPVLNLADPASIAARRAWQRTAAAVMGVPVPLLSKNEAAAFAATASASPKGQLDVANHLAALGGASAFQAAKQVAPQDAMLSRLVVLNPQDRAATINGAAARKVNPAVIDGAAGNDAREDFIAALGGAATLLPQQDVGAAFEVARNLYADWAARNGAQGYDRAQFRQMVQRAFGGAVNARGAIEGGLGEWNDRKLFLPSGVTQAAFDASFSGYRVDPKSAKAPAWADGTVMTADQLRKQFTPVLRPDGLYEFRNARGEVVVTRSKAAFLIDFRVRPGVGQ